MIDILVPVLARPQNAASLVASISEATTEPHRIVFICSLGDDAEIAACYMTGADIMVADWEAGPADFAMKINRGFHEIAGEFVFLGADDLRFHPGWDVAALEVAEKTGAGVIGTDDLGNAYVRQGRHSTHSLVRRSYAEDPGCTVDGTGEIYCELYQHNFVDVELVETASARGQWAFAAGSKVEHLHPFWKKGEMDETYEKSIAGMREDKRLFASRRHLWAIDERNEYRRRRRYSSRR